MELMLCIGMVLVIGVVIWLEIRVQNMSKALLKLVEIVINSINDVNKDRAETIKLVDYVIEIKEQQDHDHRCLSTLWDKVYRKVKVGKK